MEDKYDAMLEEAEGYLNKKFLLFFKGSPDYLNAVSLFTECAEGYYKMRNLNKAKHCYERAILCNSKLSESWSEAKNKVGLAKVHYLLQDYKSSENCLKSSKLLYMSTNTTDMCIRSYLEMVEMAKADNNLSFAVKILLDAFNDFKKYIHDDMVRIAIEDILSKLIDAMSGLENFIDLDSILDEYIGLQKTEIKNEKKNKITKNCIKLIFVRLIKSEEYMCECIINQMYEVYDKLCGDDIEDASNILKAFKEKDKELFTKLMKYSFDFYEINLLKALKKAFELKLTEEDDNFGDKPVEEKEQKDDWA